MLLMWGTHRSVLDHVSARHPRSALTTSGNACYPKRAPFLIA